MKRAASATIDPPELTPRERQILDLIMEGLRASEIAKKIKISARTVEVHRANVYRKLNVHNTVDLIKKGVATNLVTL